MSNKRQGIATARTPSVTENDPPAGENFRYFFSARTNFAVNGELVLHGEKDVVLKDRDEVEIVVAIAGG